MDKQRLMELADYLQSHEKDVDEGYWAVRTLGALTDLVINADETELFTKEYIIGFLTELVGLAPATLLGATMEYLTMIDEQVEALIDEGVEPPKPTFFER